MYAQQIDQNVLGALSLAWNASMNCKREEAHHVGINSRGFNRGRLNTIK